MSEFTTADVRRVIDDLARLDQDGLVWRNDVNRKFKATKKRNNAQLDAAITALVAEKTISLSDTGALIYTVQS